MIIGSSNNTVGGRTPNARNLISGNNRDDRFGGVLIIGGAASHNVVEGNFIGTNAGGTASIPNFGNGVDIDNAPLNMIGGTAAGARNLVSGNEGDGVSIVGTSGSGNIVQGNLVGTDGSGMVSLLKGGGISTSTGNDNLVGGTSSPARNIIAASGYGIHLSSSRNIVQGNYIGTDGFGSAAISNQLWGILVSPGVSNSLASDNMIGGLSSGAGNLISGNQIGVSMLAPNNLVQGNLIGTDASGRNALSNQFGGVLISDTSNTIIGGTEDRARNTIAFNGGAGVAIESDSVSMANVVRRNSIFSNDGQGIDLRFDIRFPGVTPNDLCDGDRGPNGYQNFPVLASAVSNGLTTTIQGTLDSNPNKTFVIECFVNDSCDPSGYGEGQTFIGSTTATSGDNCLATFAVTLPAGVIAGHFITATASDPTGSTSEFSQCIQVQGPTLDLCLQDESNGNILLVNSTTGEYQFTNCQGTTLSGVGSLIKKGCLVTLQVNGPDRRILARIDTCLRSGTASIQILSQGTTFTILDRNTANNTCVCGSSS